MDMIPTEPKLPLTYDAYHQAKLRMAERKRKHLEKKEKERQQAEEMVVKKKRSPKEKEQSSNESPKESEDDDDEDEKLRRKYKKEIKEAKKRGDKFLVTDEVKDNLKGQNRVLTNHLLEHVRKYGKPPFLPPNRFP